MALITCPDCKKNVSTDNAKCPHCGYNIKKRFRQYLKSNGPCCHCKEYKPKDVKICPHCNKKQTMPLLAKVVIGFFILYIFSNTMQSIIGDAPSTNQRKTVKQSTQSVIKKHTSDSNICKAAMAELFGREINAMNAVASNNKYHISYLRPYDKTVWGNYCWLKGNRINWQTDGANNTSNDGRPGRVRNGPHDEVITFKTSPQNITINVRYSDGNTTSSYYPLPE